VLEDAGHARPDLVTLLAQGLDLGTGPSASVSFAVAAASSSESRPFSEPAAACSALSRPISGHELRTFCSRRSSASTSLAVIVFATVYL